MSPKKNNDLNKAMIILSKKLNKNEYDKVIHVFWAMLCGVNYGYEKVLDQKLLKDSEYIFFNISKKRNKNKITHLKIVK